MAQWQSLPEPAIEEDLADHGHRLRGCHSVTTHGEGKRPEADLLPFQPGLFCDEVQVTVIHLPRRQRLTPLTLPLKQRHDAGRQLLPFGYHWSQGFEIHHLIARRMRARDVIADLLVAHKSPDDQLRGWR